MQIERDWPKDGARLSVRLRRAIPALRGIGVAVTMPDKGGRAGRLIILRLTDSRDRVTGVEQGSDTTGNTPNKKHISLFGDE
jgi:hypothetical protein